MTDKERHEVRDAIERAQNAQHEAIEARNELERMADEARRRRRKRDHFAASVYTVFSTPKERPR